MSEYLQIEGKEYELIFNYKDDERLRSSFNNLAEKTFGIDFEQWYKDGYWRDRYITYSLIDNKKIVSNVSVSIMDFLILGEEKRYLQIGTVMTDKAYRGKGLCRALIEKVLKEWEDKCDLIYLFANDSVLEFYPKFEFIQTNEYQYSKTIVKEDKSENIIKLNMSNKNHRELLIKIVENTVSFSKISMVNCTFLIMFYCTSFMKNSIYYLKDYNTIVIANFEDSKLYLQDIFSTKEIELDIIINVIANTETKEIILGFTPKNTIGFENKLYKEENTTLFIRKGKKNIFKENKLMFPMLSHA